MVSYIISKRVPQYIHYERLGTQQLSKELKFPQGKLYNIQRIFFDFLSRKSHNFFIRHLPLFFFGNLSNSICKQVPGLSCLLDSLLVFLWSPPPFLFWAIVLWFSSPFFINANRPQKEKKKKKVNYEEADKKCPIVTEGSNVLHYRTFNFLHQVQ